MVQKFAATIVLGAALASWSRSDAAEVPAFATVLDPAGKPVAVELHGLGDEQLASLKQLPQWPAVFEVRVADAAPDAPPVAGEYQAGRNAVRFVPRFPFRPGLDYRAQLTAAKDVGLEPLEATWSSEADEPAEPTQVAAVYPSSDTLPENQLKFYLHFTSPMSRGQAYEHVKLTRASGEPIDLPFLEIAEELWDRSGKRLTLLIDPGRIKQGVKPREDIGPVLEAGHKYTLVIDKNWKDAAGRPLAAGHKKSFLARTPVAGALDPKTWKFQLPTVATRQPVRVRFPAPLDHALLQHTLWIETRAGEVAGQMTLADQEQVWIFEPAEPWTDAAHWLVVDTVLEDLGGNRIGSAFEVDSLDPLQRRIEAETVRIPLSLKPAQAR